MPFPHQHHATQISDHLNVLAAQLKTRTRANLTDANQWLESVMKRFFHALMGWDLVNLNIEKPNYPAVDLGAREEHIAIQITNQEDSDKITETAAKAIKHNLHNDYNRLIIFFLLPRKPNIPKSFQQPPDGPNIECWDLADLLKLMPDLPDQSRLQTAAAVLAKDLGIRDDGESAYPSNLPGMYANCVFVGRDTFLADLRASLLKKTHATAIMQAPAATGISGLGGIGKTHAAVEYARLHQTDYSATLFVSGDSPDRLDAGFSALYDVLPLGGNDEVQTDQSVRVAAVMKWFAGHENWLLLVDNVDDEKAAAALVEYFGHLGKGHVLITSRLQSWADNVETLCIEELSLDDSIDLLLQLTDKKRRRTDDESAQVRLLAEKMDGLPLALHQAAGYINEQRLTFAEYIAIYEHEAAELLGWFKNHVIHYERLEKDTPKPVLITWKTTFDKLDADTRFWLLVFAHFAPDPIPEFLLDSAPDAEAEVKTHHRAAKHSLAQADTYSLLTRDRDQPHFKLHRLVQHILRLTAPEADRATALVMGIQLFDENYPGDPQDFHSWKKWTPLQPHAVSLVTHAPDEPAPQRLSWLVNQLAVLLNTKSLYAQAEPLKRRALKLTEVGYGLYHPFVATSLNNLAHLLKATNRLAEAEPLMRRALGIDEASCGPDHPRVAIDLNNLAQLLKATNRLAEAEPLMRRALGIDEASYGPDHPNVAIRLNNLAGLLRATNRLAEAEPLMRRALSIDEASYGPDHPDVAIRLNNLAVLLQDTKRLEEAEPLMWRTLGIYEASYGMDHPNVAISLNNLATLLQETNRLAEAEPLMRRVIDIFEKSLGENHPNVAISLNNLALLLQATSRLAEAEPLMRRALGIFVASLGAEHPNSQAFCWNYVGLLLALEVPEGEIEARVNDAVSGSGGGGAD